MKNPALLALPLASLVVLLAAPVRADDDDMAGGNILDRLGNDSKAVHQIWAAEAAPGPEADPEKLLAKLNGHLVESEILLTPESQMWVKGAEDKVRAAREAWRLRKAGSESAEIYARNLERLAKQLDSLLQVAVEGGQGALPIESQFVAKTDPLKAAPPAAAAEIVQQLGDAPPAARLFDGAAAKTADVVAPPEPKPEVRAAAVVLRPLPPPVAAAPSSSFVPLAIESDGPRVEELQRRLNAWRREHRLRPIGADGMYGPVTRAAVWRYQRSLGLPATGVVNEKTWNALVD